MFQLQAIYPVLEKLADMPTYSTALYAQFLGEKLLHIEKDPIVWLTPAPYSVVVLLKLFFVVWDFVQQFLFSLEFLFLVFLTILEYHLVCQQCKPFHC